MKDGRHQEGRTHLVETEPIVSTNEVVKFRLELGENLMMRKILLQCEKEVEKEPKQIKTLFRTKCKIEGKCCNLILMVVVLKIKCPWRLLTN